mmetsp:Transcript_12798/g.42530  ORF Transcript_12798/g.42530 Transcript_12798/m.42530 type:complete len:274 (+) Transcript_12798:279-1100(+)
MPDATGGQCHSHIAKTGDPPRCRQRRVRVRARCAARRCRRVVGRRAAIGPQLRRAAPLRHLGRPSPPSYPGARVCRTVRQLGAAARRAPRAGEQHRRRHRLAGEPRRGGGGGGGGAARVRRAGRGLSPRGAPLRPAHLAGSRWAWHGARAAGGLPRRRLHAGRPPARDRGAVEGGARCPLRHAARALYRSSTLLGDGWACRRRVPRRSLPPTRRGMGGALAREPAADAVRTGEPARGGLWRRRREVGARRSSTFVSALPKRFLASILPVAGVR